MEKSRNDPMDIDVLLEKVSSLPIPDKDKADLLTRFKANLGNPTRGEIENLNRIQNKYIGNSLPSINPLYNQMYPSPSPPQLYIPSTPSGLQGLTGDYLTTAHFEVLKNKMDSIQLELVDLLRHVKDYTQRYMNATRQQDMEKIDNYIKGLFEVDKKLKQVEEQAESLAEEPEEPPVEQESTVSRATSGIKNFLGSIGDGVASITNLVSNTARIANDTLSKKVLGGVTTPANITTPKPNANTTSRNQNQNIVSVDEYVTSNMNQMETGNTIPNQANTSSTPDTTNPNTTITSSANNLNTLKPETHKQNNTTETPNNSVSQEDVTAAINRLNANINRENQEANQANQPTQSGGASRLTKKIQLLRLKLTKKKLEEQLTNKHSHLSTITHTKRRMTNLKKQSNASHKKTNTNKKTIAMK